MILLLWKNENPLKATDKNTDFGMEYCLSAYSGIYELFSLEHVINLQNEDISNYI